MKIFPGMHYSMGGLWVDYGQMTNVPGLYAAGETAATGVHGANRLASNSLLEGLVFGARAGQAMIEDAPVGKRSGAALPGSPAPMPENSSAAQKEPPKANSKPSPASATLTNIRDVMWREVGILRSEKELAEAIEQLQALGPPKSEKPRREGHEVRNLHALALLIARSGLAREESRGSHYRSDFPYRNDEDFGKHSVVQKGKDVRFED